LSLGCSAASTLVIVVGALVAVRQLRYMRYGNEMQTLTALNREWNSEAMIVDREFVRGELPAALEDPSFVDELRAMPMGLRAQRVLSLANFYERIAMYVKGGALSEELAVMDFGISATNFWPIMRPAIAIARSTRPVAILYHFEDFAMRAPQALAAMEKRLQRFRRDPAMDVLVVEARTGLGASTAHAAARRRAQGDDAVE
jgi:hypothetical protein